MQVWIVAAGLTLEAFEKHMSDTGDSLEKLQKYSKKYAEEVRHPLLPCPLHVALMPRKCLFADFVPGHSYPASVQSAVRALCTSVNKLFS